MVTTGKKRLICTADRRVDVRDHGAGCRVGRQRRGRPPVVTRSRHDPVFTQAEKEAQPTERRLCLFLLIRLRRFLPDAEPDDRADMLDAGIGGEIRPVSCLEYLHMAAPIRLS